MRSIRTQLVLWLVGGILLLSCAAGAGLYWYMQEVLEHGLDMALAAKAQAIAGAVQMEDDGQPHLHLSDELASASIHHDGPFFYQIWRADGSTLARSVPAQEANPLPRTLKPARRFGDAMLPDGTHARITLLSFRAQADEDEFDAPGKASSQPTERLELVVAHDLRSIDTPLAVLLTGLVVAAILMTAGIVFIVTLGVRQGLRPLADVSAFADRIGPDSLDLRFPGGDKLPAELRPIGMKLNELLNRLALAFARERRFSSAVAHELRTPLAELRSACDVALRWPDDAEGLSTALAEAREVSIQMSTMVQALLTLARQQAGIESAPCRESVPLATAVNQAWSRFAATAERRGLVVEMEVDSSAIVKTDRNLLAAILANLLENAVDYCAAGGRIALRTSSDSSGRLSLQVVNTCNGLSPQDVSNLFEPFWRMDSARTDGGHTGLGLTLVKAYCEAMKIPICAKIDSLHELTITLRL